MDSNAFADVLKEMYSAPVVRHAPEWGTMAYPVWAQSFGLSPRLLRLYNERGPVRAALHMFWESDGYAGLTEEAFLIKLNLLKDPKAKPKSRTPAFLINQGSGWRRRRG